jgi:hypothetical protein
VAFLCYLRLAGTLPVDSDGASVALQAWDMLHGNLLLHGWRLSDVSFYTTELPEYMVVELVTGRHPDAVHAAAALSYTLMLLLTVLLANSGRAGSAGLIRVMVAGGIMLAPQLASGVNNLIASPDHVATTVLVLVIWVILDRSRQRWYIPVIAGVLLAWGTVADPLILFIAALPLVLASAVRIFRSVVTVRESLRSQWYYLALIGATIAGAAAGELGLHLIESHGGFQTVGSVVQLGHGFSVTVKGLLLLGGADFLGLPLTASTAAVVLHLASVLLAALATLLAVRRFLKNDLVDQVLVLGLLINLGAYAFSTQSLSLGSTRQIVAVLAFSAALAGRLLAERLLTVRFAVPALIVVLAGYLAGLGSEVTQPQVQPQQLLVNFLVSHDLRSGLAGYWQSNVVTLASGGQIDIRLVTPPGAPRGTQNAPLGSPQLLVPGTWEVKTRWYDPAAASADYVVLFPGVPTAAGLTDERAVLNTFGQPAHTYRVGAYRVLVWKKNLLQDLR